MAQAIATFAAAARATQIKARAEEAAAAWEAEEAWRAEQITLASNATFNLTNMAWSRALAHQAWQRAQAASDKRTTNRLPWREEQCWRHT